ncbi:MAG: right-handed parallel beta-helix repeat-containing protein [Bacteroidota bacterium]
MLCLFLFPASYLFGTNYYLSENGTDQNDGKSPEKAWKSLIQLNTVNLKPGDTVFFHAAHHFTGSLRIFRSGKENKPIVYTSYGGAEKPIISGAYRIEGFRNLKKNLYTTRTNRTIKHVFQDNRLLVPARYPNSGFLKMDGGGYHFCKKGNLDFPAEVIQNSIIRLRPVNWSFYTRQITEVQNDNLIFNDSINYLCQKDWGFYLEGKSEYLDHDGEWHFDRVNNTLSIISDDPENIKIEGCDIDYGIYLDKEISNIIIENIHIEKYAKDGILINNNNRHVTIQNCKISNCVERGINLMPGASFCTVKDNEIADCYGQGISLLEANNSVLEGNFIHRIGLKPGIGISGVNGATGILITGDELKLPGDPMRPFNNVIRHNRVDSTGYNGIRMDGYNSVCEYNVVKNVMYTLNDGGIFYCWAQDSTFTHHNIVRNNILLYSHGNIDGTPGGEPMCNGLYIDNRVNHILAENNVITGAHNGIVLNDNTNNIIVRNNISYNNANGIIISEWWVPGVTRNNTITQNTFISPDYRKQTLTISSVAVPDFYPGVIDSNTYISLKERFHLKSVSLQSGHIKRTDECSFEGWKLLTRQDPNSKSIIQNKENSRSCKVLVNEKNLPELVQLCKDKEYRLTDGTPIKDEIRIEPLSARVLLVE